MSEFDWTYDIEAEVIYVGSKFRIDISTVINGDEVPLENWSDGEFIEFEISWIGPNLRDDGRLHIQDYNQHGEVVNLVINDCKMPEHSMYEPGYNQIVEKVRVQELVNSGYWESL